MKKEELLQKYFLDGFTSQEHEEFKKLLEEDSEFQQQFEFEKSVKRAIKAKKRKKLHQKLKELENSPENLSKGKVIFWKPFRIAASIAVVVSLGIYVFNLFQKDITEHLYADNYEKYPNTVFPIKRGADQETSIEFKAFEAYDSNNDDKAIRFFKELKTTQNPEYVDFYLAQSYLKVDQIENAILAFRQVMEEKSKFSVESRWYLALAYLKNKNLQKATTTLEQIVAEGGYKSKEAKELLEVLD